MSNLRSTIESLATQFATSIIGALRGASLDELLEVTRGGAGSASRARAVGVVSAAAAASAEGSTKGTRGRGRGRGGRLGRRSASDIAGMIDAIVSLLESHPDGLRAEQIREALGVEAKELPRPLADALEQNRVTKTGQKRATTYFAGSGGESGSAPKRRGAAARGARGRKKRG